MDGQEYNYVFWINEIKYGLALYKAGRYVGWPQNCTHDAVAYSLDTCASWSNSLLDEYENITDEHQVRNFLFINTEINLGRYNFSYPDLYVEDS